MPGDHPKSGVVVAMADWLLANRPTTLDGWFFEISDEVSLTYAMLADLLEEMGEYSRDILAVRNASLGRLPPAMTPGAARQKLNRVLRYLRNRHQGATE